MSMMSKSQHTRPGWRVLWRIEPPYRSIKIYRLERWRRRFWLFGKEGWYMARETNDDGKATAWYHFFVLGESDYIGPWKEYTGNG
jgi:hypothetical protein